MKLDCPRISSRFYNLFIYLLAESLMKTKVCKTDN